MKQNEKSQLHHSTVCWTTIWKFDIGIQITLRTCGLMLEGRWYEHTLQKRVYLSKVQYIFLSFYDFVIFFGMQEIIPA